jgi:predicted glycogen debranching enzyme
VALSSDIYIDSKRLADLNDCRQTEWLATNGRGGYAMAAVNQMLTRRYHGLLVAAVHPPLGRYVLLAKLEVTATVDGLTYELGTNDYPEAVHPQGFRCLESFSLRPYPTWRWRVGQALIEQTLCMAFGEDTTFVQFRLVEGEGTVTLALRPLCTSRHFHELLHYQDMGPPTVEEREDGLSLAWSGKRPTWHLAHNGSFRARPDWYYQFVLSADARRGYDFTQDLFVPGIISAELSAQDATGLVVAASTEPCPWSGWKAAFEKAARHDDEYSAAASEEDALVEGLVRATGDFVVMREGRLKTVIAGYPWFGDWGRDTFISLPGLCLVPGRLEDARLILEAFAKHVDGGMIPNRFPDYGESPEYNTADAALWFIHAADRYLAYGGDWDFVSGRMFAAIAQILDAHEHGTRHGIAMQDDGLLFAGETGLALTWMDARVAGRPVTPRIGKPVEINALWFNALQIGSELAARRGEFGRADRWRGFAVRCAASFNARFWNAASGCLNDIADPEGRDGQADGAIRPNQLLAISLTHPVLDRARWRAVVDVCQRDLWTPTGMRTLAPHDPAYQGRYEGDMPQRDSAYHQGTAWPWLLGPFVTAYVRAYGDTPAARATARKFLQGVEGHLRVAGLGSVSEVAQGDAPHRPDGCPWQAWSVAEPLRALCEDILRTHPGLERPISKPVPLPAAQPPKSVRAASP